MSNSRFANNSVCLVTGGTRGIGAAIARIFADEGACVVAVARHVSEIPDWAQESSMQKKISFIELDVSDSVAVRDFVLDVRRSYGRIDVLVNNAGVEYNELLAMSNEDHMRQMFETNVYGTIFMSQYVSRVMRQKKNGGSIINIASGVAMHGNVGQSVYGATKGAVIAFTRSAAKELACDGITVNAVAPGLVDTDMMKAVTPERLETRVKGIALGRLAHPEEIADACAFLASKEARYITGQVISVDGGAVY